MIIERLMGQKPQISHFILIIIIAFLLWRNNFYTCGRYPSSKDKEKQLSHSKRKFPELFPGNYPSGHLVDSPGEENDQIPEKYINPGKKKQSVVDIISKYKLPLNEATRKEIKSETQQPSKSRIKTDIKSRKALDDLPLEDIYLKQLHHERRIPLRSQSLRKNVICNPKLHPSAPCKDLTCKVTYDGNRNRTTFRKFLEAQYRVPEEFLKKLQKIGQENKRKYRLMIATASSSNHFQESQKLLKHLHELVFPNLTNIDYVFVYYDLGLTAYERNLVQKYGQCQLRRFPLEQFPKRLQILKCYAWKPMIIAANLPHCDLLLWVDSSVRFTTGDLSLFFKALEESNVLISRSGFNLAQDMHVEAMNYYGYKNACVFSDFFEYEANFLAFANTRYTREAIMAPWISCTFAPNCMCPKGSEKYLKYPPERAYNKCHRFDQTSINMILISLYGDNMKLVTFPRNVVHNIKRGDRLKGYLEHLARQ